MAKKRIVLNLSEEAANRLDSIAIADNCSQDAIVEHLLMGRMLVEGNVGTVPELSKHRAALEELREMMGSKGRESFVRLGPRMFSAVLQVVEKALK